VKRAVFSDTILQRLSGYIEKAVKLKRAVQSALIYPIAVLLIAGGIDSFGDAGLSTYLAER